MKNIIFPTESEKTKTGEIFWYKKDYPSHKGDFGYQYQKTCFAPIIENAETKIGLAEYLLGAKHSLFKKEVRVFSQKQIGDHFHLVFYRKTSSGNFKKIARLDRNGNNTTNYYLASSFFHPEKYKFLITSLIFNHKN